MANQANHLRDYVREHRGRGRVLAVTSGKGGVGKTSISVNLAVALAARGARTILLDADLGLANVEVLLGLNSLYNLQQVIQGERTVSEVLVKGPGNIQVIPGSSGIARIADLGPKARERIISGLDEVQGAADFIIIDTMAGIGQNAVAFAAAADEVLLVATPEPSSIVDAYAMMKTIYQMRDDAYVRLVVNMALNEQQGQAVAQKLSHVAKSYLGRQLGYLGYLPRDPHVSRGVMQTHPFFLRFPNAPVSRALEDVAARLNNERGRKGQSGMPGFIRRFAQNLGLASNG